MFISSHESGLHGLSGLHSAPALQVRSIIGQVRPDRQTLLFSATMPNKVERLVQDALTSPVRVTVGEIGEANDDIKQARSDPSRPGGTRITKKVSRPQEQACHSVWCAHNASPGGVYRGQLWLHRISAK